MASWFTRTIDKLTPWDRKGEVQRRQERKKRDDFQSQPNATTPQRQKNPSISVGVATPTQTISVAEPPKVKKRPTNIFQDINRTMSIGRPKNEVGILTDDYIAPPKLPQLGETIKPTVKVDVARPNQDMRLPDGRRLSATQNTPENILNRELDRGKSWEQIAKDNNYQLDKVREYSQATRPNYGITIKKPKQSFGDKVRDVFDANTEADKYRRYAGNIEKGENKDITLKDPGNIVSRIPVVGHTVKAYNTTRLQLPQAGLTVQQKFATDENVEASNAYIEARKSGDPARITEAKKRLDDSYERLDDIQRKLNKVEAMFKKNNGGLFNVGSLYDAEASKRGDIETGIKDIALPTAVAMLDAYTMGKGNSVQAALTRGGTPALRSQLPSIGGMAVGNYASGDLDARSQGATGWQAVKSGLINSILGTIPDVGLPLAWQKVKGKVMPRKYKAPSFTPNIADELDDAAISASAEAAYQATKPRPIRVTKNIPVTSVDDIVDVPVTRTPSRAPLIKELEGDYNFPKFDELQQVRLEKQASDAASVNNAARPDKRIEGVTPRKNETYTLDETAAKTRQDEITDEYASFLKGIGEGNGTQLVPDGEAYGYGLKRTTNNVRFGDTKGKRMTKADWRDEAERQLRLGQAEPSIQKEFNDAVDPEVQSMLAKGDTTEDLPAGRPIKVQEAKGIPVRDETVVPTDLPETPGTVRVTEATDPMAAKTKAVAETQQVYTEGLESNIPVVRGTAAEYILNNPKQFTKRQVAAARNQRKLARQMAKVQEDTAEAISRIEATRSPSGPQGEGFAPTGRFGRGKRGNAYEKASGEAEAALGRAEMEDRSVDNLLEEIATKESFTPGDRRRIAAALENIAKADPNNAEVRMVLRKLQTKSRTELGQALAMIPKVVRRSASADTLVNRWESKIARALDNPSKMTDADLAEVMRANDNFTLARDTAARLEEQFKRTGSESDFKAWEEAHRAARKADEDAKFTEVAVAKRVLKGEKGAHVNKVLDDLRKESNVNTMDLVTANMLSGTATGFRNTFGTELAGIENRLFANTRAKVTKALFGENVGGFNREGARMGRKIGMVKLGRDAARRAEIGGKNPLEWAKNWSTTINSGGESSLQSQVYSRLAKYYQNEFKAQGLTGKELDMRMRHAMITDPDAMGEIYLDAAMKSSGLTGLFEKGQTIEKAVTDYVGGKTDSKMLQGTSKLIMRMAVGFPTATANFMYQSAKRLTLGLPSYLETGVKLAKGDKLGAAQAFDRALKESGSGVAVLGLGAALGKADMISGPYPSDPDERARWEREGISENSIKIGGAWYPIPQGAGMLGLPLMVGAAIGREGDSDESVKELFSPKNLSKLMPTDQIQGFLNMASGDGAPQDFKNFVASSVRAVTPVGALLNQIAKSTDDTKNDTTTKSLGANIMDQIYSGIPGVNNAMDIPDKTDDAGNPIQNPNALQLAVGATSASQGGGIERSAEVQAKINDAVKNIDQYGLLNDPNMEGVLEGAALESLTKLNSGKQLDESDIKALKEGLVKGVSQEGTDTAYLEREEYDTNLAVLKLKRDLMNEDKTTKPSSLKDIETAIKRGEIYKEHQIPYELISNYKGIGVEDWRKMGIPPDDEDHDPDLYDPKLYQKLWDIDRLMTKAGVSYGKGKSDKQKYYIKESKKGSGSGKSRRSRASELSSEFGRLGTTGSAPRVQEYASIDQKSGGVPIIRKVRPNIVHKIGSSE